MNRSPILFMLVAATQLSVVVMLQGAEGRTTICSLETKPALVR